MNRHLAHAVASLGICAVIIAAVVTSGKLWPLWLLILAVLVMGGAS